TDKQVGLLRAWIDQGAKWSGDANADARPDVADWWSLKPLMRPRVPALESRAARIENAIDAFVVAKLREKGLGQSAAADRQTLIRRLYFDLIGLPPKPAEIEAFVASRDPNAYERLVDHLLA